MVWTQGIRDAFLVGHLLDRGVYDYTVFGYICFHLSYELLKLCGINRRKKGYQNGR